jgi:hypothetical protein
MTNLKRTMSELEEILCDLEIDEIFDELCKIYNLSKYGHNKFAATDKTKTVMLMFVAQGRSIQIRLNREGRLEDTEEVMFANFEDYTECKSVDRVRMFVTFLNMLRDVNPRDRRDMICDEFVEWAREKERLGC